MIKIKKNEKCGYLNPKALAIAVGVLWGVYVFLLGLILTAFPDARFFWISKELLAILATLYPGYSATVAGSFMGLFWALICGALGGTIVAWLHNYSLKKYCR